MTDKMNTCSDYNIPINNTNGSTIASSSSVLDQSVVEARGNSTSKTRDQVQNEIQSHLRAPLTIRREIRSLLGVLMFVTRLPVPEGIDIHPGFLMKGMGYFPVIGSLVGIVVASVWDAVISLGLPSGIAASLSTAVGWWLTGCFHEDGLTDSADGIGGGWTREQILKIMTDSRVGTYGAAVLILYTITKIQLLSHLDSSSWKLYNNSDGSWMGCYGAGPALVLSHTLARLTAPYLIRTTDYIDDEQGPKSSFYAFMIQAKHLVSRQRVVVAVLYCFGVGTILYGPAMAMMMILVVLIFAHMAGRYGERILGGVMGDFLGATICICELLLYTILLAIQQQQKQYTSSSLTTMIGSCLSFLTNTTPSTKGAALCLTSLQEHMYGLLEDERVAPIARFLVLCGVYVSWVAIVKHAAFQSVEADTQQSNGVSADASNTGTNDKAKSPLWLAASKVLESPTSTFNERYDAVQSYIDCLAKPVGSLGTLEGWAARLAAIQRTLTPDASRVVCLIFAGDHGVAAAPEAGGEGCSAYPQLVTRSVLVGLQREVAGASVLAKANNVQLRVVDVGVVGDELFQGPTVISSPAKLTGGTKNFCKEPAMSVEETYRCMRIGGEQLAQFIEEVEAKVVCLGEVGIGNTTSSSALIAALTRQPVDTLCGGGAFASRTLQESAVEKKIGIVKRALSKHYANGDGLKNILAADALTNLGGSEIAAMVGAMLEASERNVAVLVDGFIATAAALIAVSFSPKCAAVMFFTSRSAEEGQQVAIDKIQAIAKENNIPCDKKTVLSMELRMGEATAALLAVPILRSSSAILSDMATIQEILS